MMPAARLAAAIDILEGVARGEAPTRDVLVGYFRARRYAGSGDRAAIRGHVYDTIRDLAALKWHLARAGGEPERPRHWVLAAAALAGGNVAALFSGDRHAPARLDAAETALAAALAVRHVAGVEPPEAARLGCPAWLEPKLRASLGAGFSVELAALNAPAPVDLRVNTLRADRRSARDALARDGIDAALTPWSPVGLRLAGHPDLERSAVFRNGLVEPQDEGSQLLALAVGAVPGERVVDYCAGGGGKTLALAAAMAGQGRILACDVSMARLRRMLPRLGRAGVAAMVELHELPQSDGAAPLPSRSADRVLVDAPCSGTGTWRRHPFQRWRLDAAALEAHVRQQAVIFDAAAELVRPGGWLVYATCSLLDEENGAQADAFARRHDDFARRPADQCLPTTVAGDRMTAMMTRRGDLRLTPARHGTDGVFAACFERKAV